MTPSGFEPATFVAQHLNHCATAVPHIYIYMILPLQVSPRHCPTGGPPRRPKLSLQIFFFHVSTPTMVQSTVLWVLHRVT